MNSPMNQHPAVTSANRAGIRLASLAVSAIATMIVPAFALADVANTNLAMVSNVVANCISTANPIAFGTYSPLNTQPLTAVGALVITCTQGATPSVVISLGANPSGSVRRMTAGAGNYLPYTLLTPTLPSPNASCAGATTEYPTAAPGFALTPAPNFAPRTFTICGQIAAGISVPSGTYSDTVLATVSF